MKMLSIRQWMLVGIAIFMVMAGLFYHITGLFIPESSNGLRVVGAVLAIAFAFFFVRWQMGRYVVKPLEAMSAAARRIAGGNLDFDLPESRVREVADVRNAFEAMGEGLRDSLRRQADLEEERRFFIGAIAHDLRTPLFSLRGYLEGLEQGLASSPEKAADYIAVCRQKADQLDRLVSDLFAYTKVEYLEQTLQRSPVDFGSLLCRAVEGARDRAHDKGVTLEIVSSMQQAASSTFRIADKVLPTIRGDEHLLERAVENLLDNAVRYTPAGGKIEVRWCRDRDRVVFTVADTGPGIAPSDMPHLFDPLYRGETSRNRQTGGAGLGLAIARRALLAHGGDLVAANRPTGGAEFTGWLPVYSEAQ
jgi:signal transduction histidine kinase